MTSVESLLRCLHGSSVGARLDVTSDSFRLRSRDAFVHGQIVVRTLSSDTERLHAQVTRRRQSLGRSRIGPTLKDRWASSGQLSSQTSASLLTSTSTGARPPDSLAVSSRRRDSRVRTPLNWLSQRQIPRSSLVRPTFACTDPSRLLLPRSVPLGFHCPRRSTRRSAK